MFDAQLHAHSQLQCLVHSTYTLRLSTLLCGSVLTSFTVKVATAPHRHCKACSLDSSGGCSTASE